MIKEESFNLKSMLEEIGQIVLENKRFNEYKSNKDELSLILAIESLIKSDIKNYDEEDIIQRMKAIERFYDLDNPDMISNKITGKSFLIFNHVKKLTI